MVEDMGVATGIDLEAMIEVAAQAETMVGPHAALPGAAGRPAHPHRPGLTPTGTDIRGADKGRNAVVLLDLARARGSVGHSAGVTESGDAGRLRSLLDIAKVVGAARSFDDLIELTAEEARRALDAASLSITRWEGEQGLLRVLVNVGVLGPHEVPVSRATRSTPRPGSRRRTRSSSSGSATSPRSTTARRRRTCCAPSGRTPAWACRSWSTPGCGAGSTPPGSPASRGSRPPTWSSRPPWPPMSATGVVQADHFARIERLAFQDPLTGLANRRAVDDRLEAEVRPGAVCSVRRAPSQVKVVCSALVPSVVRRYLAVRRPRGS